MNKGKIIQVMGPVVDVQFTEDTICLKSRMPLTVENDGKNSCYGSQHNTLVMTNCKMYYACFLLMDLYRDMEVIATGSVVSKFRLVKKH